MPIDISPAGESARPPPFTVARGAADNAGRPDKSDGLSEGEMIVDRDFIVTARDGVGLATDVYRPAGHGPFPVLLERTPYDKSAPSRSERTAAAAPPRSRTEVAAYFVRHGYAVVYQDCRGRYKSEGRFTKYLSEAEDGFDTLVWLVRQPWCNGRIGTFGLSYAAHTQAALGCLDPPGLAAQFLDCGGFSNAYRSGIRHGGAFDLKQATWAYNNALADAKDPAVNYLGLSRNKRRPARLILGPWTHGDRSLSYAGDVDFGPAAPVDGNLAEDFFALRRLWFDRWLKGAANDIEAEPPVRVFVMGG